MKVKPFSFYSLVLGLGLVIALCICILDALCCFAGPPYTRTVQSPPVPEKVLSQEAREVRVFLKNQRFGFYEWGALKFSGPVCTGRKGMETPKGKFRVLMRAKNYFSRKYDGAAMPYAVQFTTGGHFLHVGEIRPKPASHGCVRLYKEDAKRIFGLAKKGDSVIITD